MFPFLSTLFCGFLYFILYLISKKRFEVSDFVKMQGVNTLHILPMSFQHNTQGARDTQESVNKIV